MVVRVVVGCMVVVGVEHGSKGVVPKWVAERVSTAKECSEEIEGIRGMEVCGPVEIL